MNRTRPLLAITFLGSPASVLLARGAYFYTVCRFKPAFTGAQNLWLALAFGLVAIIGALVSHPLSVRLTEKNLLAAASAACCLAAGKALAGARRTCCTPTSPGRRT